MSILVAAEYRVQAGDHSEMSAVAYWSDAFTRPEARPFLTLLFDLPTDAAIRALPVAAAAFPDFPIETAPPPADTSPYGFASWRREGTHSFSLWSCENTAWRSFNGGGGLGCAIGNYYHHILPELRRPSALLWRDVRGVLVPAAGGLLSRGDAFAAAALGALDTLIAQQGFRDMTFMAEVQEQIAGGNRERLLALLPQSRHPLTIVRYRLVRGPKRACWEGYLPVELTVP